MFDPERLSGLRVLIVDDNRTNRLILEELLGHWGAVAVAVDGGTAALAALDEAERRGEPFAVALLDWMMPGMDGFELAGRIRAAPRFAGIAILMLSSWSGAVDPDQAEALEIAACLTKPVGQSELLEALTDLLARSVPDDRRPRDGPTSVEAAPADGPGNRLRVLLAEDHPINQVVAIRMLEEQGHEVTVVGDGRAAVEALATTHFDVVLMDVQMPVMDGFEAVAEIRRRTGPASGRHP